MELMGIVLLIYYFLVMPLPSAKKYVFLRIDNKYGGGILLLHLTLKHLISEL
jgi:K+ transporter